MTEDLTTNQKEIVALPTIDFQDQSWRWITLLCEKAIDTTNAQTHVFAELGVVSENFQGRTSLNVEE